MARECSEPSVPRVVSIPVLTTFRISLRPMHTVSVFEGHVERRVCTIDLCLGSNIVVLCVSSVRVKLFVRHDGKGRIVEVVTTLWVLYERSSRRG